MTALSQARSQVPHGALEPLVSDLLERARADARTRESAAVADGQAEVDDARRELETALEQARSQGATEGRSRAADELAAARRSARTRILAAQAQIYQEARLVAGEAVGQLLASEGRRDLLRATLRRHLGQSAEIRDTPDGGLVGRGQDGRAIDASAASLADGALAGLDVGRLWAQP